MEKEERTDVVQKKFTVKGLANAFFKTNKVLLELEAMDPNVERFTKMEQHINDGLRCHCEIYEG